MNNKEVNNINKYADIYMGVIVIIAGIIFTIFLSTFEGRGNNASFFENSGNRFLVVLLLGIVPILGGIYWTNKGVKNKNRIEEEEERQIMLAEKLKNDYFESLKGLDKSKALQLGREYYGSLREDGRITIYDEQAITNDINSMTNTFNLVNTVIHKVEKEESKLNNSTSNQKTLYCSKCGKAYIPDVNKLYCEECGNKY